MGKCQIIGCENEATLTVSRRTSEEERNEHISEEGGLRFEYKIERFVCADHLELAQKEYP